MVVSEGHFAFLVISNSPDTVWVSQTWACSAAHFHRQHQYWRGQASLCHSVGSAWGAPSCLISRAARYWVALEVFGSHRDSTSLLSCGYVPISVCPRVPTWDSSSLPGCCGTEWLHFPLCSWFPLLQGKWLVDLCACWHDCQCFLLLIISVCIHLQYLLEFLCV